MIPLKAILKKEERMVSEMKQKIKKAAVLYCVIYTVVTILNSVLYLANGIYEDPSGNWHELTRAVIVLIGIMAWLLACSLPIRQPLLKALVIYVPTMGLVFFLVFLSGFIDPLAKHAYRDIFINYTGLFVIISVVSRIVDGIRKRKKN